MALEGVITIDAHHGSTSKLIVNGKAKKRVEMVKSVESPWSESAQFASLSRRLA